MSLAEIKALIVATSAYYGQKLEDHVVGMYADDLADLSVIEIARVLKEIRRDPKTTRFPLPATIRDRLTPAITPENEALEAVSRIIAAISKIGPYRVADAREFVGELGWAVVQSEGSWENVCQNLTDDNLGMLRAQWKNIALTKMARAKNGMTEAPGLPSPKGELKQMGFGNLMKQIPQREGIC